MEKDLSKLYKRRYTFEIKTHENMLSIISHQGNAQWYYDTPIRMAKMRMSNHTKYWWGFRATGTLITASIKCSTTLKDSLVAFSKVTYIPTLLPSHSTLRYLSKKKGIYAHDKTWIQMIIAVLFGIAPN